MSDQGMNSRDLLEGLLELASAAELEVRVQSQAAAAQENALTQSAACRVGTRIWVVLSPSDPPDHQAEVLGEAALNLAKSQPFAHPSCLGENASERLIQNSPRDLLPSGFTLLPGPPGPGFTMVQRDAIKQRSE